jgi:hypothetical protein
MGRIRSRSWASSLGRPTAVGLDFSASRAGSLSTVAGCTMRRLDRQLAHRRDSQTQKIRSPLSQTWSAGRSLKDEQLMAERHVLKGDRG